MAEKESPEALSVEEMKARIAELEGVKDKYEGIEEGTVQCLTFGCEFGERPAKFRKDVYKKYFKDPQGNETDRVENSTTFWHLLDQSPEASKCPDCGAPLNQLHPGSQSVFPKDHRFQYHNRNIDFRGTNPGMKGAREPGA